MVASVMSNFFGFDFPQKPLQLQRWLYAATAFPKANEATRLAAHASDHNLVTIFQESPRLATNRDRLLAVFRLFQHAALRAKLGA